MARTTAPKTVQCTNLEWEQIRAHAKRAGMPISRYVMACLFDRHPKHHNPNNGDNDTLPDTNKQPPPMKDLFDEDYPLILNAGEQRHLYDLVKYIAATNYALLQPIGNAPIGLREMVYFLMLNRLEDMRKAGRAVPNTDSW